MTRQNIKQAIKDGVVVLLRVVAALAAVIADGTYWLYDKTQTKFAPPKPPRVTKIRVRQLGLKTGQIIFVRRVIPRKIEVQYVRSE